MENVRTITFRIHSIEIEIKEEISMFFLHTEQFVKHF